MTTTSSPSSDDPAAARVDALRAALAGDPATPARPGSFAAAPTDPSDLTDPDELADRLRRRRSAAHVAAAYSAAHGHPLDAHAAAGRRWALDPRTAVAAACALLLVAVVTVGLALWPQESGGLVDLAAHEGAVPAGVEGGEEPADLAPVAAPSASAASPAGSGVPVAPGAAPTAAAAPAATPLGSPAAPGPSVVVHVVGKVAEPGLVTLPAGARVADALDAAGGATGKADLTRLNLARTVVDGEQVQVPAPGETPPAPAGAPAGEGTAGTTPAGAGPAAPGTPVPLNTADVTALDTLPGVGPVLAERIVAWRDANGPFTSVDELTEVSGIGPSVLDGLRDLVVV